MYYPIIDKLKDVMADIGQGGGVLVIEGDFLTHTWTGSFSDIENAFINSTPVYFKCTVPGDNSVYFNIPLGAAVQNTKAMDLSGSLTVLADNTFTLLL